HILTFAPVDLTWKLDGPSLTDSRGRSFSVASAAGSLAMTDAALGFTASYSLDSGSISRVTFAPTGVKGNHTFTLQFSPALAAGSQSSFEVIAGKKTKVASGSVQESPGPAVTDAWSFSSPDAMKGLSAKASETLQK
ncbi:MAG TPA: hypothetical protein VME43_13090, partial [Bryobacteraceae bacterium]|nr:hypothetical protein [Bryobacteraceae bacterium]